MWRRLPLHLLSPRSFFSSSSQPEIPTLYSFLQPTIFAALRNPPQSRASPPSQSSKPPPPDASALDDCLLSALRSNRTNDAWKSFKSFASHSLLPSPAAADALVAHLSTLPDRLSLKRAFASAIFLLERCPRSLSFTTLHSLFLSLASSNSPSPALALITSMFNNRLFPPVSIWAETLIHLAKKSNGFGAFLKVFEENCKIALEEKIAEMKPSLGFCNEVLDGCCRILESVKDAERVLEIMSALDLAPDSNSFASLAYLYALKRSESRIVELDRLMDALGFGDKSVFYRNLVSGYVKSSNFESVSSTILRALKELTEESESILGEENYKQVVRGFAENGRIKDLATLIIETQELESSNKLTRIDSSVGFGIINACVGLGWLDKAHSILDEMNAQGASVGLGVYSSILRAYCKEQRTAEAAQLVMEISAAGLQLEAGSYDALIDAAMSTQDFQSAFSLFRDMREARLPELKTSYLTIMTGLMENHRPELMASFLDTVVDDPRIEVATHDWNSIIHAFCKIGRLEDARRTYRRMLFLRFEPNNQTYLSLINGYISLEKYFSVLLLWTEVRRKGFIKFDHNLVDAFLYALVKGGFFDAAMQVVEKAQELKIYVDKWRHKQAFMETHKKLKVAKVRRRNFRKMEALIAFKNWAGLNA